MSKPEDHRSTGIAEMQEVHGLGVSDTVPGRFDAVTVDPVEPDGGDRRSPPGQDRGGRFGQRGRRRRP